MDGNLLHNETSPYLLQHRTNPVHWRPWGEAALDEARRLQKPILLSVGYAACHWCHVMAHESFEDAETAAVMNRHFVNIKVDREERPDIDQIYMAALHALGEQGGWPLTMFLTPNAEPVWGGTYFPKEARYGRPAFVDVLKAIADTFANRPDNVESNRAGLLEMLFTAPEPASGEPTAATLDEAATLVARLIDRRNGGFNGAPKFPQPTLMELLWRTHQRTGDPVPGDLVTLTLRHIVQGGIYDHLGGGIARYAVDERWLVPHFEKMLYDNALLLERLASAYRATGQTLFRLRIEETAVWLLRDMMVGPAFASSVDADSPGGEGAYYVWTPAELRNVLGPPRAADFAAIYGVSEEGNFEGASILNRLNAIELQDDAAERQLTEDRAKLLARRADRPPPGRDDKVLADWNGLAIAGLTAAALTLGRQDWLEAARSAYRFVMQTMVVEGRLRHSYRGGILLPVGFASDYGALMRAALSLHAATAEWAYIDDASHFADILDRHYWDGAISAYRLTADDADALIARPLPLLDESVPSANALIGTVLSKLARLTGEPRFAERVHRLLRSHIGSARDVLGKAGLFNALDEALFGTDVIIVAPTAQAAAELRSAAHRNWQDGFVLSVAAEGRAVPRGHPAFGKGLLGGKPTAYVCRGQSCSLPVTEAGVLIGLLSGQVEFNETISGLQ